MISVLGALAGAAQTPAGPTKAPAVALVDAGDAAQWQAWTKEAGWHILAPTVPAGANIDARVEAIQKAVAEGTQNGSVDPARVYLAGRGAASAAVFYAVSRLPGLWAAAVALGGSPQPAIDSDRLYLANFTNVPVLWFSERPEDKAAAENLRSAGMDLEWRPAVEAKVGTVLEWLARHHRAEYPDTADCETDTAKFAGCYWIQMTKFDPGEQNDVLPSTLVRPPNRASLDLGGFGFKPDDPGPGVPITFLPDNYRGQLKLGDRLVALDGRPIANPRQYLDTMAQVTEERPATVTVERGKQRIRIETKILFSKAVPRVTARVQGKFLPEEKEIQIISRSVTEMRVTIPAQWAPAMLNWNGVPLEKVEKAGCRVLRIDKELESAAPCP